MSNEGSLEWLRARRRALYRARPRRRDHWDIESDWQKRVNSDVLGIMRLRSTPKNSPQSASSKISRVFRLVTALRHYRLLIIYLKYRIWQSRN